MTDQLRVQALELAQKLFPTQNPQELVASAQTLESYLRQQLSAGGPLKISDAPQGSSRVFATGDILTLTQCSRNAAFFANKMSIPHPLRGTVPFAPYDYQNQLLAQLQANKLITVTHSRQLGISTTISAFVAWAAAFQPSQTIMLCSNSFRCAMDLLDRLRVMMSSLPDIIQPVVVSSKRHQITLDNGTTITASAITENTGRGMAINLLVVDNAAYVSHSMGQSLATTRLPVVMATGGRVILASSAGDNCGLFYDATRDTRVHHIVMPWGVHPDHDAAWAEVTKRNLGLESFAQEYECQFKPAACEPRTGQS